jgi:hypothetical protein
MWLHSCNPLSGRYFVEEKLSGFGVHYTPHKTRKAQKNFFRAFGLF